jgi:hypothetical protein
MMELSCLMLVVVTGLLQSMVDATPQQRMGQTFLRRLYDRLHALEEAPATQPRGVALYYSHVALTAEEWLDLDWWEATLWINVGIQAYSQTRAAWE